jgi:hypothetical protein
MQCLTPYCLVVSLYAVSSAPVITKMRFDPRRVNVRCLEEKVALGKF